MVSMRSSGTTPTQGGGAAAMYYTSYTVYMSASSKPMFTYTYTCTERGMCVCVDVWEEGEGIKKKTTLCSFSDQRLNIRTKLFTKQGERKENLTFHIVILTLGRQGR